MKASFFVILLSFMLISGCSSSNSVEPFSNDNIKPDVKFNGTVGYTNVEGGFFIIKDELNNTYDPLNMPERFMINGLKVYVEAKRRSDLASIRMMGEIIEISKIVER